MLPLTQAMPTLLALVMVGLGDLWLWAAQPASKWPLAAAEAPLSGARVQSCQALMAHQRARSCGKIQPGVKSCQDPALARARAPSCQALMAHQRAHASGGVRPGQGQGLELACAGVQSCHAPAQTGPRARSCQALLAHHCAHACGEAQPGVQSCQAPALTCARAQFCRALKARHCGHATGGVQLGQGLALACTGVQSCQAPTLTRAGVQYWQTPALTGAGFRPAQAPAPTCAGGYGADRADQAHVAAGLRTLLSGDGHPHPGPLRTAIVNTTSLRLHMDEVTSWDVCHSGPGDLVVRVYSGGRCASGGGLCSGGRPPETRGRGIWDVPVGGVAVLVGDGHAAAAAKLPKKRQADPLAWDLWLSARFPHVRVAVRTGSTVLHVLCVYGVPGDPELNAELWDSVLKYAARLGNAPFVVGRDFNFPLGELGSAPPVVLGHLLTQRLVDVDAAFAARLGDPSSAPSTGRGCTRAPA